VERHDQNNSAGAHFQIRSGATDNDDDDDDDDDNDDADDADDDDDDDMHGCNTRTSLTARAVLSPSGKCSSSASTKQLAMIVISTMYSNGLHDVCSQGRQTYIVTPSKV